MAKRTSAQLAKEKEIEKLRAENESLKTELHHQQAFGKGWRLPVIGLSVALATAFLIVGNILFWTGSTLLKTDNYSRTVTAVVQDKAVQEGIAAYATAQLFNNVDVQQIIQNALPPRADFLAAPLTTQVEKGTQQALKHVLASDKFQATWAKANVNAHDKLISAIKNSKSDGTIDLQNVYDQLAQSLSGGRLSFLANKSLPDNVGSITVINISWLPTARTVINNIDWIKPVALLLVAGFSALAIWLTRHRRKLIITLGVFFSASMLASLISFRLLRSVIVSHADPAYQTAVDHAVRIISTSFVEQTVTILAVSLLIVVVAWVSGPYRAAVTVRSRIQLLFSGRLHQAIFGNRESGFTRWVAAHKRLLEWLAVALLGFIMLLVQLSPHLVLGYALLMVVAILVIETLAAPHSKR